MIAPETGTISLTTNLRYSYLGSNIVKEVAKYDEEIGEFLHPVIAGRIREKPEERRRAWPGGYYLYQDKGKNNMMSGVRQLVSEAREYIDSCKFQALSNNKIIMNREELEKLLVELRFKVPDEIKKYQKVIGQQDIVLGEA